MAILVVAIGPGTGPTTLPAIEGYEAPEIVLKGLDGSDWSLSSQRGKVLFINYWATWWENCREEFPSIQRLYDKFKDHPDFRMVTILYRDKKDTAVKYMADNNLTVPLYIDPEYRSARTFGTSGVPETFVLDRTGVVQRKIIGPADFSSSDMFEFFSGLLEK